MNCDQAQPLLDTFADGELEWGPARRVRRHLAGCSVCAAELAEIRQMNDRVRAWQDMPAPAGLQGRIAAALPPAAVPAPRRFPVHRTAVGLAGVAAAAAAFFWLLPGQPGQPTIALADVEQAMQQVQTISWTTTIQASGRPDPKPDHHEMVLFDKITFTNWLRRSPPALAAINYRARPTLGLIKNLTDARGAFALYKDHCEVVPLSNDPIQRRVEIQLQDFTEFPQSDPTYSRGQARLTRTNLNQRYVVLDGQRQVRFDRDLKTVWTGEGEQTTYQLAHASIWADPKTHRIARSELHISEDTHMGKGFRPFVIIKDHFRYDQVPPKGTFDWSPPPGATIVQPNTQPVK